MSESVGLTTTTSGPAGFEYVAWVDMSSSTENLVRLIGSAAAYDAKDKSFFIWGGFFLDSFDNLNNTFVKLEISDTEPNNVDYKINPWKVTTTQVSCTVNGCYTPFPVLDSMYVTLTDKSSNSFLLVYGGSAVSLDKPRGGFDLNQVSLFDIKNQNWFVINSVHEIPFRYSNTPIILDRRDPAVYMAIIFISSGDRQSNRGQFWL